MSPPLTVKTGYGDVTNTHLCQNLARDGLTALSPLLTMMCHETNEDNRSESAVLTPAQETKQAAGQVAPCSALGVRLSVIVADGDQSPAGLSDAA